MSNISKFGEILLLFLKMKEFEEITIEELIKNKGLDAENIINFLTVYHKSAFNNLIDIRVIFPSKDLDLEIVIVEEIINKKYKNCSQEVLNGEKLNEEKSREIIKVIETEKSSLNKIIETKKLEKCQNKNINLNYASLVVRGRKILINKIANIIDEYIVRTNEELDFKLRGEDVLKNIDIFKVIKLSIAFKSIKDNCFLMMKEYCFGLNNEEYLELYTAIEEVEDGIIENKEKILSCLEGYKESYDILSKVEVIKKKELQLKDNKEMLIKIKKILANNSSVDIINKKNKKIANSVKLYGVVYDVDSYIWKLKYIEKKKINIIGFQNISMINEVEEDMGKSIEYVDKVKLKKVKFRVFHEFNAREKSIRFAIKHKMKIDNKKNYSDFTVEVEDTSLILRFARNIMPSMVILEPIELREKVLIELEKWEEVYR